MDKVGGLNCLSFIVSFCCLNLILFKRRFTASVCLSKREKRRDLLTPQSRHWYALTGTLSGTPDVGVPRTVSCESKLPVLDWTAAEAANLFFRFVHIKRSCNEELNQSRAGGASRFFPKNA
jgi:hypothetical protein